MSNLGAYQEFSTNAKQAGGVDAYLHDIEQAAFLKGTGLTLTVLGGVTLVVSAFKKRRAEKRLKEARHEPV